MLARKEKQNLVIKLYKQDKTVREIAKEAHMSFSDIGTIIKQEFGDEDVNKDAQIFKLFEKGTKLLDIAIEFNISANEVQRIYSGPTYLDPKSKSEFYIWSGTTTQLLNTKGTVAYIKQHRYLSSLPRVDFQEFPAHIKSEIQDTLGIKLILMAPNDFWNVIL